jgi:hypothetical protein
MFAVSLLAGPAAVYGSKFPVLGARPQGMGGAFVAVAEGPGAPYWNPAALGTPSGNGFQVPVQADFEADGDVIQALDDVAAGAQSVRDLREKTRAGGGAVLTEIRDFNDAVLAILSLRDTGKGALIGAQTGFQGRSGRWGLSVNQFVEAGITGQVDTEFSLGDLTSGVRMQGDPALNNAGLAGTRDDLTALVERMSERTGLGFDAGQTPETVANRLINDAESNGTSPETISAIVNRASESSRALDRADSTGSFGNNQTNATYRERGVTELAVSYGAPLFTDPKWGALSLGGSAKLMRGEVSFVRKFLLQGDTVSGTTALQDARKSPEVSYQAGFDAGLLYRFPFQHKVQVGVLGRNVNSPEFDAPPASIAAGESKYKEDAQARAGLAYWPFDRWVLTGDADLSKNKTSVPGYPSQTWSVGTEVRISVISLRAGMTRNFRAGQQAASSLGLGLRLGGFNMDMALSVNNERVDLEGKNGTATIPSSAQAGLTLGWIFR